MTVAIAAPVVRRIDALGARALMGITAAVALVVRVLYLALLTGPNPLDSDASQYHFLAARLADGEGYVDQFPGLEVHATAFRPPGYPALLAAAYKVLWPSPGIGRALNIAIGVAVVAALTALVFRHLGGRAALAAGLGAALLPNFVANDTYILTEPLSLLLLLGLLATLLDDRWVLAGITTGLLILTRPSAQYLAVLIVLYLVWRIGWRRAGMFALVTMAVVAPWIGRNWVQLGSPVLVTSNGFNYAALYSPAADERDAFTDPLKSPAFDDRRVDQLDEVVWDRNLRQTAVDHVRSHPGLVPRVAWRNLRGMLELKPSFNRPAERHDGRDRGVREATFWVIWPLVALGVVGVVTRRHHRVVALAAVIAAYFTLASLVFVAFPRLRSPMELMLIICAAALLSSARPGRGDGGHPQDLVAVREPPPTGGSEPSC